MQTLNIEDVATEFDSGNEYGALKLAKLFDMQKVLQWACTRHNNLMEWAFRQLEAEPPLQQAQRWLEVARESNNNNEIALNALNQNLKAANASYEDIGTSGTEIQELLRAGYLWAANKWLETAREQGYDDGYDLLTMKRYLRKAKASLRDIGTSRKEVSELRAA